MTHAASLILGTAQFGHAYGITNALGRLTTDAIAQILREAQQAGVTTLDTARAYGDADDRIGVATASIGGSWRAITKITLDDVGERSAVDVLLETRVRVGCENLDVLLHRPSDLLDARVSRLLGELREARDDGVIDAFGVSIYDAEELGRAVEVIPDLGIVQLPGSLVDRRLLDLGVVADLAAASVQIHVRSAFLQGLLLASSRQLPDKFWVLAPILEQVDSVASDLGTTRLAVLLFAVRAHPAVTGVVVGATSVEEWRAILEAPSQVAGFDLDIPMLSEDVLDPRRWRA